MCGYGRNGRRACEELKKQGIPFAIIEHDKGIIDKYIDVKAMPVIYGEASREYILIKANIKKATHIISTLPDDAQNVFIALTAKELKPEIIVISRLNNQTCRKEIKKGRS